MVLYSAFGLQMFFMDGDFNGSLVLSIKETLTGLLGLKIYDALAYHLFKFHDITPEEIPYRLDTLDVALKQNFGSSFTVVKRPVLKHFYGKLGLVCHPARIHVPGLC
jgi:hypothetical protein